MSNYILSFDMLVITYPYIDQCLSLLAKGVPGALVNGDP